MKKVSLKSIFGRMESGNYNLGDGHEELPAKAAFLQIAISLLASLSVISSGMGLGYPAITTQLLLRDTSDVTLTASQVSWFASVTAIACPIGGPLAGYLSDKIGRRSTMMVVSIVSIVSWILIGFSSRVNAEVLFIQLMIGRAIIGIGIGMTTAPVVMYVSEVCHPKLRGRMTMLSSPFFTAIGLLTIYFLGYLIPTDYRLVSFIAGGITLMSLFVSFFLPESPVFLITKNKIDAARKALALLRNLPKDDVRIDEEILNIKESKRVQADKKSIFDVWKEFLKPELYKPFFVMVSFFAIQQFSGIFTVFIYAAQFSLEAGVAIDEFLSAVIIGVIRCCTTIVIAFASDRYGRKPLAISSGVGMFLCMLGLAACIAFPTKGTNLEWLPSLFLFAFIFSGTLGILTLPFAMVAEVYPQKSRGFAVGITVAIGFALSFINVKTFSTIFEVLGSFWTFSFYAVIALVGVLFAIFILPETKGKSLQEIENHFRGK